MRVVLVRHAEATKNMAGSHGGTGSELTARGVDTARELGASLAVYEPAAVYYSPPSQCRQTAELVASTLRLEPVEAAELRPYHLGIADGLTHEQLERVDPHAAARMAAWRAGKIDITDLDLPGAADPVEFFRTGVRFLDELTQRRRTPVAIVGTRSILVLLWNVLTGKNPEPGGGYREVPWTNCQARFADWPR